MDGKEFRANLNLLEMTKFDVILGMEWLKSNYRIIRRFEKEIVFQKPEEEDFFFIHNKCWAFTYSCISFVGRKNVKEDILWGTFGKYYWNTKFKVHINNVPIVGNYQCIHWWLTWCTTRYTSAIYNQPCT